MNTMLYLICVILVFFLGFFLPFILRKIKMRMKIDGTLYVDLENKDIYLELYSKVEEFSKQDVTIFKIKKR